MRKFSEICAKINDMKTKLTWTKYIDERFERLKKEVETQLVLVLPSFEKAFLVECDASNIAIGEFLGQEGKTMKFFSEMINE